MLNLNLLQLDENKSDRSTVIEEISSKEIAVIGISLKLPMANNVNEFWSNLENGIDCVTEFPEHRKKDVDNYLQYLYGFDNHPGYDIGSYLDEIDKFDYEYFKLSPKESSLMDPNQRLFLQTAMEALDDAGYVNEKISGSKVGVYVGFHETLYNYRQLIAKFDPSSISISLPGNLTAIIASRISYFLNLTGPSLMVDTACSSSLVAVHLACQGIRSGDCEMAIAGGVRINLMPVRRDFRFGVESSSGRSRAFDEAADGISSGEGVAAVILKPLSKAIMHNDNIYAVIKGSAINQDGSSVGITAPNIAAQEDVIVKAWKDALINPEEISFIETHGTGTKIGDPIEIEGIQRAFKKYTERKQFCAIGSLKTNLGHLDNAAGIAGFIKSVLQLKYKKIVPLLHFKKPNSRIPFEESPLYVNDKLSAWETEGFKRQCGVSSFGLSGTNCHVILEEAPCLPRRVTDNEETNTENILTLSSMTKSGVEELLKQYDLVLGNKNYDDDDDDSSILDFCYTANVCKKKYNYRLAVIFDNFEDLKNKIDNLMNNNIEELQYDWVFYGCNETGNKKKPNDALSEENTIKSSDSISEINNIKDLNKINSVKDICELFVDGNVFDWEEYYRGDKFRKISLPSYPFKKNRCWLEINAELMQNNDINEMKNKIVLNIKNKEQNKKIKIKGNLNNEYSEIEKITAEVFCEVLGYDEIDINSNIFDIGIDSILAVKIINNLNDKMNINVEVAKLLCYETIKEFSDYIEKNKDTINSKQNENIMKNDFIERKEIEPFELSYSQNRLWLLYRIDKKSVANNMPGVYEIYGELDKDCFNKAFLFMLDRHDSLRTIFIEENGIPLQRIIRDVNPVIEFMDLTNDPDKDKKINELINDIMNVVFDLSKWPLMKLLVVKTGDKQYKLMFNMHHIISDGWSFSIFMKEILLSYNSIKNNVTPEFVQLKKRYKDFILDQNKMLTSGELKNQEKYWLEQLSGNLPLLNMPLDYKRPSRRTFKGDEVKFFIYDRNTLMIKDFCKANNITPNIFFLAVYCLALNKYTGDNDIIIGSVVNGRKNIDLELIIGIFINYLPIRIKIDGDKSIKDFFSNVKNKALEAYINQDYPFDLLIDLLSTKINSSHNPIYDTMLVYHSQYFLQDEYDIAGLKIKYVEIGENKSILDLKLDIFEYDDKTFVGKLQYSVDLFTKETITGFVNKFNKLIDLILEDSGKNIIEYEIFSNEEKILKKQEEYWLDVFKGEMPVLNMPLDYPRPSMQRFEGNLFRIDIDRNLIGKIRDLVSMMDVTLYMILLSAYNILLSKYTGQEDIVVGTPIAGRSHSDIEGIIGVFINTLAMRNYPERNKSVKDFINDVRKNSLDAFENQDYQFENLVEKIVKKRDMSRNPVFDTMLLLQNQKAGDIEIEGLKFKPYEYETKVSKFDISVNAIEADERIVLEFEYCNKLFDKGTIDAFAGHYINILKDITENPDQKISEVEMLSREEKNIILNDFNNTKIKYPKNTTIHKLFEIQVEKTPDNAALVCGDKELTYDELNRKSNILANKLRAQGIAPDDMIGIMINRSVDMIVGIMGILKSGAAYLPIDPEYPDERIRYMLEDSNAKILVTTKDINMEKLEINKIFIEADENLNSIDSADLSEVNKPTNLAYVIYTSGSTGKPKGVMIEHRSVINFIKGMTEEIKFHKNILALTTISFDIFVLETLLPLTMGMKVIIADEKTQKDPVKLCGIIKENNIEMLQATPSRIKMLLDYENCKEYICSIKTLMIGGEAFPSVLLDRIKEIFNAKIYNMYGPTETTVWSTVKEINGNEKMSIGKPISNTRIYIVDISGNPVPIGVFGELCIAGDGLARGYHNKPELTEEKFIPDPFKKGERMYRTGDLARWMPDGNIEFQGRSDGQVKIRGFRIELGEIENKLMKHEFIREACVIAREDGNGIKYLCAYLVSDKDIPISELREYLSKDLPDYMIPSYFIKLDKMPLTPNGKIDRKVLPEPENRFTIGTEYEAPENEIEKALVSIWEEVLKIDKIGVNDNFFDLGGNSLKVITLISRINKEFKTNIYLNQIMQVPTIKSLADFIRSSFVDNETQYAILPLQNEITGVVQLTVDQNWYLGVINDRIEPNIWNIGAMIKIKQKLDYDKFRLIFENIIRYHDGLRSSFHYENNQWIQRISPFDDNLPIRIIDLKNIYKRNIKQTIMENIENAHRTVSLGSYPLFHILIFQLKHEEYIYFFNHHLIADGYSCQLILNDLNELYDSAIHNEALQLPPKTLSIKQWGEALHNYACSDTIKQELNYWTTIPWSKIKPLPVDFTNSRQKNIVSSFINVQKNLTKKDTKILFQNLPNIYHTLVVNILLYALTQTITEWSQSEYAEINTVSLGRDAIPGTNVDLTRTVGWLAFSSVLMLPKTKSQDLNLGLKEFLKELEKIPNQGYGYSILTNLRDIDFDTKNILLKHRRDELLFNFMYIDDSVNSKYFERDFQWDIPQENVNNRRFKNLLTFNVIFINEILSLNCMYSKNIYLNKTIKKLVERYFEILQQIINLSGL